MMGSNWDRHSITDDGRINVSLYITDIDYAACYTIYNQEPPGDKTIPAQAAKVGKQYVVQAEGQTIAQLPTDWTQLPHHIKTRGPLQGEALIQWRAYDEPQRFMVKFYLKGA